ncbi:MAG: FAD-binding oxidoreductase [Bryobacteraceae bacterium]|nr:FAD-binding oxidoreductase [Bryobacteraceae bacterium]
MSAEVIVAGAGIVGAAIAEALASAGVRVTIIERAQVGGGATAAGMGHVVVMDDSEAQFALTKYSRDLWQSYVAEMPPQVEHDPAGTLWVAADEEELQACRQKQRYYAERQVESELLDAGQLQRAEPNLVSGLAGGLRVPGDSVIYAPCAAKWLLDRAISQGAKFITGTVVAFEEGGVRLTNKRLACDLSVCAFGTAAAEYFPNLAMRPRKGHLVITDRYPGFVRHQLVELGYLKSAHGDSNESVAFNAQPRRTGQVLLGSSREFSQTTGEINDDLLRRMIERALRYMPALANLNILRTWTGFRAATPDKLPLIGLTRPGIYLATGHEGLGITTSLGTARLLADQILRRQPAIPVAPYLPGRFRERVA